ncbi:MAG: 4Fe-4S dicluster domain-containing protein [Deltaproteobacteria bacterium]|nr:4Fe-4S dicluster domain-containing protein [Deltaproteobacteria bacterium]MBW2071256.1 4Fe-4S dicluster domain-containing protein [Deltaproteobacteria bacterium]
MTEQQTSQGRIPLAKESIASVRELLKECMQCGTCTGSCANSYAMDITPRKLWRLVQLGFQEEIFASRTFSLCSSCYYCTLRCPRGLPLTETIHALKRLAAAQGFVADKKGPRFYRSFLGTVRRYGRVREMELMGRYFLSMKNPLLPLAFAPLGVKLMLKGKVAPEIPRIFGPGKLEAIYRKVEELESGS